MALTTLIFSDLFVTSTAATSWFKATPDSMVVDPIPPDCVADLQAFRQSLIEHQGKRSFLAKWPDQDGMRLRVERIDIHGSEVVFVCRRWRYTSTTLASLGMPEAIASKLLAPDLKDGLVVFFGKAGAGKTTTAAACISERLSQFGGVCWTIENPIELPLQGAHGAGWCYQTEVANDSDIGPAVRHLMRATPNIIFIGELRDGLAVQEAVTAATSGHLVVATAHASGLIAGLTRLVGLMKDEKASSALAEALRIGVHLSLHTNDAGKVLPSDFALTAAGSKGTGTPPRILAVTPLMLTGLENEGAKSKIRDGKFHELSSDLEFQKRRFLMNRTKPAAD